MSALSQSYDYSPSNSVDAAAFTHPKIVWIMIADRDTTRFFARENQLFSCFHTLNASVFSDEGAAPGETRQAHAHMIKDAAMWLDTELGSGRFDQLVVIAAQNVIDELHGMLSSAVSRTVISEIVRSMSEKSEIELAAELPKLLPDNAE